MRDHVHEHSETDFWPKVLSVFRRAGREVIEKTLVLYLTLKDPGTPAWAKGVIAGALAYFVSPLDGVPDPVPVVGYSDDLLVLGAAIAAVAAHITPEIVRKARKRSRRLFGGFFADGHD